MALTGFRRPTLDTLVAQTESDIASALSTIDTTLPGTPLWALARTIGGAMHQLYGLLDWVADQTNVLYATDEALDGFGAIWDVIRKQATAPSGSAAATGVNGSVIPEGTELRIAESGINYVVTADATITNGTATIMLECAEFGERANLDAGTALAFVEPVAGVNSTVSIVTMTGGSDLEGNTAYRQRILDRIHQAPHGGAAVDYVTWAKRVPGVTRAWAYPVEGDPGVVVVRFMMDDTYQNGIPQAGDVADVQVFIEERRPITAEVFVYAPTASAVNVTITGLVPSNTQVQAAIRTELSEMIKREAVPGGTLYLSQFWDAISQATGVQHFTLTTPSANVTKQSNAIAVLGTVTFA